MIITLKCQMTREMCNVPMGRAGDVALPLNPESFVGVLTRLNNIFCAFTRATTPLFFLPIELRATFASCCISVHCHFVCCGQLWTSCDVLAVSCEVATVGRCRKCRSLKRWWSTLTHPLGWRVASPIKYDASACNDLHRRSKMVQGSNMFKQTLLKRFCFRFMRAIVAGRHQRKHQFR